TSFPTFNPATTPPPYIWEGKAGEPSRNVKVFDLNTRRTLDREAAERSVAFMERNVKAKKPFFLYYPITQIHFPTLAHPDFDGKTGAGDIGDAMADVDYNTGLVLDAIDRLGIARNTLVFWCTDNGAEARRPWRGPAGFLRAASPTRSSIRSTFFPRLPPRPAPTSSRRIARSTASTSCRSSRASSRSRIATA